MMSITKLALAVEHGAGGGGIRKMWLISVSEPMSRRAFIHMCVVYKSSTCRHADTILVVERARAQRKR